MKTSFYCFLVFSLFLLSCETETKQNQQNESTLKNNPFATESTLEYNTPDFNAIEISHYMPAFKEGMRQQTAVIDEIVSNKDKPTFENTVLALEKSNVLLDRVANVFFALTGAHTNDELKALQTELSPMLSTHGDNIYLNNELFQRIKEVYQNLNTLDLDDESKKLVEEYYTKFTIAGANLSTEEKENLKEVNSRLASLQTKFSQTLQEANNAAAITVENTEQLSGLSDSKLNSLKTDDGNYQLAILNTTQQPLLQNLQNRDMREMLFNASIHRADHGEHNTSSIIKEISELRAQKAKILGFNNYAEWSLQNTMAKQPANVINLFDKVVPSALQKAKAEASEIQAMIDKSGDSFALEPWDWQLYAEKVRKEKYNLDINEIKPYFELKNVLENGVFYAAEQLYGITAKERTGDFPTYHEDVIVYELFEEDGTKLGLFYGDYFARPSKRGGAWMSNFVTQSKLYNKKPVIYNVMNISKPSKGEPALLTYDEVETMFHEFGHALHGFFANQQYPSLSGTAVARDFVEFPSQFNENWALYPTVLTNYAKHYETGELISNELVEKIKNAGTFNQGYSLVESLAAASLDMQWHMMDSDVKIADAEKFEEQALSKSGLDAISAIPPRYRSTYFSHVFGGGYAAGYYSYLWTEMLHHDAFQWFRENGELSRENGQRFREMILSKGNTEDYETMYRKWRGKDPEFEPLLKARGLN